MDLPWMALGESPRSACKGIQYGALPGRPATSRPATSHLLDRKRRFFARMEGWGPESCGYSRTLPQASGITLARWPVTPACT